MAYPVAPGIPQMSGVYVPEIWSGKTLVKFYDKTVFAAISNIDYEGEIKKHGDKVIIRTIPDMTINPYVKGQKLTYATPTPETIELLIDKGHYWAFAVNDVDEKQSDIAFVEKWTTDASEQLGITMDTAILADVYADADASNKGATAGKISQDINLGATGTPLVVTKDNILDIIVDLNTVFNEQSVPENDRKLVIPAWACGLIKKSDLKDASLTGDGSSILRNGRIGMIDRFEIFSSNNIESVTDGADTAYNAIACQREALTFASQLTKNETIDNPDDFGKLNRGLQVYGYKVIKPEALIHLYIVKG